MDYINKFEKAEVVLVGGVIILGVLSLGGFLTFETLTNFDEVKKDVEIGKDIIIASTGEPIIEHVIIPVGERIVDGVTEPINAVEDIFKYGTEEATERGIEREQKFASLWLEILGSDIYNDGFLSIRYTTLRENAEALAKFYKKSPFEYFRETPQAIRAPFLWDRPYDDVPMHIISPFKIRQNLDSTPFAKNLHGLAGTDATTLKHFVWTDYDKVPEKLSNWKNLTPSEKNDVIKLIKKDKLLLEAMENKNTYNMWIVKDRVFNYNNLLKNYNIII